MSVLKILNHNFIIKHIETIETKSILYIVTELVSDGDLFDYVIQNEFLEGNKHEENPLSLTFSKNVKRIS